MKCMKSRVLPAMCLALATTPAIAADAVVYDPIPTPSLLPVAPASEHWSGFYVGVSGGYSWGNIDAGVGVTETTSTFTPFCPTPPDPNVVCKGTGGTTTTQTVSRDDAFDANDDGWLLGGQIGYNYRFGNVVAGVEADLSYIDSGEAGVAPASGGSTSFAVSSDYLGTLRGRVGYAFDRVLLYGTAGAAFTDLDGTFTATAGGMSEMASFSKTVWGWTAGVGAEVMVTDRISVKTEYLYADFGDVDFNVNDAMGVFSDANVDLSRHIFRVGLNYHF